MVKITQNIEAAYEVETTYGDPPRTALSHLGLLDTFDPRMVEMNITPTPSIGQSTDTHHARGPINVTLPLKIACQGTGWKQLLGHAIGVTNVDNGAGGGLDLDVPHKLTNDVSSFSILAKETGGDYTLVGGVVPNEVTLTADYSTGGYITLEASCTGQFSEDDSDGNFSGTFYTEDFRPSTIAFPTAPSTDPLLATDLTVYVGTNLGNADASVSTKGIQIDGPVGSYVEVGEGYIRAFTNADILATAFDTDGAIPLDGVDLNALDTLITGDTGWDSTVLGSGGAELSANLVKGIYKTSNTIDDDADSTETGNANIYVATDVDTTGLTKEFDNLKTVVLKLANNNTSIPGKTSSTWLQNNKIARGKSDVTLDITMTAEDETWYDKYVTGANIPLIRLDFGASVGSVALTNGTITSFSRPLAPGGEIVDTMSIKFRGAGDYKNFSSFAISADWTL